MHAVMAASPPPALPPLRRPVGACCRTDVVEFVSTEHTPRNLLIRAVKQQQRQPPEAAQWAAEYVALKRYWGVTPHLERLLAEQGQLPPGIVES